MDILLIYIIEAWASIYTRARLDYICSVKINSLRPIWLVSHINEVDVHFHNMNTKQKVHFSLFWILQCTALKLLCTFKKLYYMTEVKLFKWIFRKIHSSPWVSQFLIPCHVVDEFCQNHLMVAPVRGGYS